jgi:hypothetical protein
VTGPLPESDRAEVARRVREAIAAAAGPGRVGALRQVAAAEVAAGVAAELAAAGARAAAVAGADYRQLGDAVGITRQGARRRWPGLADLTTQARTATGTDEPTSRNTP